MKNSFLYKKFVSRIIGINDTPESIALGAALGVFISMTPTVGIQMIIIVILNSLFRANRMAGVVMVYISNPLTVGPIYWGDYLVGSWILGGERESREALDNAIDNFGTQIANFEVWAALQNLGNASGGLIWPTFVGGCLLGLILALPSYPLTLRLVRISQRRKMHKEALLAIRDQRRAERESKIIRPNDSATNSLKAQGKE